MTLGLRDAAAVRAHLLRGGVIPAHPLALHTDRTIDERSQVALTRYYLEAGAMGLAVGVHTTGFRLHDVYADRYPIVLQLAMDTVRERADAEAGVRAPRVMIAGLVGDTAQATREARLARDIGYHAGLLSLGAWRTAPHDALLAHCRAVAAEMPLIGFYLQPAVGGRVLDRRFWAEFATIDNVVAVKIAPFDRYATLDVVQGLADAGRTDVALLTGNDDHIVGDLVTPFDVAPPSPPRRMRGGLLGQWAVWTRRAVELVRDIHALGDAPVPASLLALGTQLTLANAAIFDVAHGFRGCLPGILHVLQTQGLVTGTTTLDDHEALSPGQAAAIDAIRARHPTLTDDDWVTERLDRWRR